MPVKVTKLNSILPKFTNQRPFPNKAQKSITRRILPGSNGPRGFNAKGSNNLSPTNARAGAFRRPRGVTNKNGSRMSRVAHLQAAAAAAQARAGAAIAAAEAAIADAKAAEAAREAATREAAVEEQAAKPLLPISRSPGFFDNQEGGLRRSRRRTRNRTYKKSSKK